MMADSATYNNEHLRGCPCFGTIADPQTRYMYPTPEGTCHAGKKPSFIPLDHQSSYCLSNQFANCPLYKEPAKVSVAARFRPYMALLILLLLAATLGIVGTWLVRETGVKSILALSSPGETGSSLSNSNSIGDQKDEPPLPTLTPSPISTTSSSQSVPAGQQRISTATSTVQPTDTDTPTATSTPTETSSPSPTATNTATNTATPTNTSTPTITATPSPTASLTATLRPPTAVPIFKFPTTVPQSPPNSRPRFPGSGQPPDTPQQPPATKISLSN
jgi:hypothetical protein